MEEFNLKNNIKAVYKENKNTPRVAVSFDFAINDAEKLPGTYSLLSRLMLQGTKNRKSEVLAEELDRNAIELSCDMKQDYLRFRFVCLNEDFERAVEITSDVIKNSTFEEFEKEKVKMSGEILADLDAARVKAVDNYYKTIFDGHFYGNTYTRILENLDKITKDDVINAYKNIVSTSKKILSLVGDVDFKQAKSLLDKYFGDIENSCQKEKTFPVPTVDKQKTVEIIKEDAQQAQIIQGWIVPTFKTKEHATLAVMNILLGASGLSSRLFQELREKKGLAYVVRTSYETNEKCANFNIYIATEPKNVQICLDGFKEEIEKLKKFPVGEDELANAKNNLIGRQEFITETNYQQANLLAYYDLMGLGFDYLDKIIDEIKSVTPADILECANKCFTDNFVVSVLKP
jgi:predicted Zn-dependent peptidase